MAGEVTSGPENFITRRNQVFSFAVLESLNIGLFKKYRVGGVSATYDSPRARFRLVSV